MPSNDDERTVNPWSDKKGTPSSDPLTSGKESNQEDSQFGEKFGNDYGFGHEGEYAAPQEGSLMDESDYVNHLPPPEYTELTESESPFAHELPLDLDRSDDEILSEVQERLNQSRRVDISGIEIAVHEGEVTLSGTVNSLQAYDRIEDVTSTVMGVKSVRNRISITG
ncbi:MAG: BON domain-containing protein [Chloroflexi bacterium]|nr:MAG: BON domain-containing protein [Chloroflexota bacterium]